MIRQGLTQRQLAVLNFVVAYIEKAGVAPTFGEIGKEFGISLATVHEHVHRLADKRYVRVHAHAKRGIVVLP